MKPKMKKAELIYKKHNQYNHKPHPTDNPLIKELTHEFEISKGEAGMLKSIIFWSLRKGRNGNVVVDGRSLKNLESLKDKNFIKDVEMFKVAGFKKRYKAVI